MRPLTRYRSTLSAEVRALLSRYAPAPQVLGAFSGERLVREAGSSLEFFDVRPYGAGDELRYVDWKAYARTGKLWSRGFFKLSAPRRCKCCSTPRRV